VTLERKLYWIVGLVVALALVTQAVLYFNAGAARVAEQSVQHTQDVQNAIQGFLSALQDVETAYRGYVIAVDETLLEPLSTGRAAAARQLQRLRALNQDNPDTQINLQKLGELMHQELAYADEIVSLRKNNGFDVLQARIRRGEGEKIMEGIREQTAMMLRAEATMLTSRRQAAAKQNRVTALTAVPAVMVLLIAVATLLLGIREQVRLAAALREQKQIAQVRERLLGIVGHDLRNPLASITTAAYFLEKAPPATPAETRARMVRTIISSAGRMTRMINELLDFTRARLGNGIPIEPQPVDAVEICRRSLEEMRVAHPDRTFQFDGPNELAVIWDAERIAQVLANLVKNAVDYGDGAKPVSIALAEKAETVLISVHNDGPVIPAESLADVFDPFKRGGAEAERRSEGIGLGLYIVERIADGHGGGVAVASSEAQGTTFTVTIPRDCGGERAAVAG